MERNGWVRTSRFWSGLILEYRERYCQVQVLVARQKPAFYRTLWSQFPSTKGSISLSLAEGTKGYLWCLLAYQNICQISGSLRITSTQYKGTHFRVQADIPALLTFPPNPLPSWTSLPPASPHLWPCFFGFALSFASPQVFFSLLFSSHSPLFCLLLVLSVYLHHLISSCLSLLVAKSSRLAMFYDLRPLSALESSRCLWLLFLAHLQ